jgi:hypothetical protein
MLNYDPLQIFHLSKTPIGLYARQKWLGEGNTTSWSRDYDQTVASIEKGQLTNGSWKNSLISTVKNLFDLHLTVRETNSSISGALDWLIAFIDPSTFTIIDCLMERITMEHLRGIPFSLSHYRILMVIAILFLATVFRRGNDNRVIGGYEQLEQKIIQKEGYLCGWKCLSNVLRALVVHEYYSNSRATTLIVKLLRRMQTSEGNWKNNIPFYRTLNALAHLDTTIANSQFELALKRLHRTQSRDGSWGRVDPEFSTFLVVHALKRKYLL